MDVREIRIGNYIKHSELGVVKVVGVGLEYIHCVYNNETHYESINKFESIELTEDLLIQFGFYTEDGDQKWIDNELVDEKLYFMPSGIAYRDFNCLHAPEEIIVKIGEYGDELEIKYLHQLQNIVFDLKGDEFSLDNNKNNMNNGNKY